MICFFFLANGSTHSNNVVLFLLAEKKILVTLTQALDSQAKELKSFTESISHTREPINITRDDRFSQYRPLEDHAPPVIRNGQYPEFMCRSWFSACLCYQKRPTLCCLKIRNFWPNVYANLTTLPFVWLWFQGQLTVHGELLRCALIMSTHIPVPQACSCFQLSSYFWPLPLL
jgi:hypothetical protein